MINEIPSSLLIILERIVRSHSAGLSEAQLIKCVRQEHDEFQIPDKFENSLSLFRSHFLLFHMLYRLQTELWDQKSGHLEISPLCIRILSYQSGSSGLRESDTLRSYYLDLQNLDGTSKQDVDAMLTGFWKRYLSPEGRKEALKALGLEDPVDDQTIKTRYRKLAMEHHPDRGGDTEQLQTIHAAIRTLLP